MSGVSGRFMRSGGGGCPVVDRRLVKLTYSRSQGPGGQHVNTTSSRVDARFNLRSSEITKGDGVLAEAIAKTFPQYVSKSGDVIVTSQRTRSQQSNVDDCLDKLQHIVDKSFEVASRKRRAIEFRGHRLLRKREEARRKSSSTNKSRGAAHDASTSMSNRRRKVSRKKKGFRPQRQGKMWVWSVPE